MTSCLTRSTAAPIAAHSGLFSTCPVTLQQVEIAACPTSVTEHQGLAQQSRLWPILVLRQSSFIVEVCTVGGYVS